MGIFDNASSVVIGNKEVQSIVRVSDGAVLYQKAASHSYALAFSSATYQTDSSGDVTVYVTLTDNGVPVSGESISFSDGSSLYTGITNNNGVASLNYNCQANKTLTASFGNVSASCSIISNYVPSGYTGTLSNTLTSFNIINNSSSEVIDISFYDLQDAIYGGYVQSPVTTASLNSADKQEIFYNVIRVNGEFFSDNEFPVDVIDFFGDDTLYVVIANDYYTADLLNVSYAATSATDVTITISQ